MVNYGVRFNNSGLVTTSSWTSGSGAFSIRIEFTTPASLETDGLLGTADASTASDYIAAFENGNFVVRMSGSTIYNSPLGLIEPSKRYSIELIRASGTALTVRLLDDKDDVLNTSTISTASAFTFTQIGRVGQAALPFNGVIWRVIVTGGTQNRSYESTTNTGSTWVDSASGENGSLESLANDGSQWVLDEASVVSSTANLVITGAGTGDWVVNFCNSDGSQIEQRMVSFASDIADEVLPVAVGSEFLGYILDSVATPTGGAAIAGTTV